jgi:hypothetical protein
MWESDEEFVKLSQLDGGRGFAVIDLCKAQRESRQSRSYKKRKGSRSSL